MISIIPVLFGSLISLFGLMERNDLPKEPLWRQIVLMRSTREDVEKLLGHSPHRGYSATYTVENGTLQVEYYPFKYCEPQSDADLRVPQWTVVEITYIPDNPPKLTDLKLNLRKFRRQKESSDAPDLISYISNKEGVDYTFQADNTLNDIRYFPGKRYDSLRCSQAQRSRKL